MELRFSKEVRRSVARELKLAAWFVSGGGVAVGAFETHWLAALVSAVCWGLLQTLAHVLLALEDDDDHRPNGG